MTETANPTGVTLPHEALSQKLHVEAWLGRIFEGFGLDVTCVPLVTWVPAIELAWSDRLNGDRRRRLHAMITVRHPGLSPRARWLLDDWLQRRPGAALFRTARAALRAQVAALPPDERPALRARILGPCVEPAGDGGGVFGASATSADERRYLEMLVTLLRLPDDPAPRGAAQPCPSSSPRKAHTPQ